MVDNNFFQPLSCFLCTLIWSVSWGRGQLCTNSKINHFRSGQTVFGSHYQQNVGMRQTALLPLDCVHPGHNGSKHTSLCEIGHKLVELPLEHSGDNVGPILCLLTGEQMLSDLIPFWIAGDSDEQVRFLVLSDDCHTVLEFTIEPTLAA